MGHHGRAMGAVRSLWLTAAASLRFRLVGQFEAQLQIGN